MLLASLREGERARNDAPGQDGGKVGRLEGGMPKGARSERRVGWGWGSYVGSRPATFPLLGIVAAAQIEALPGTSPYLPAPRASARASIPILLISLMFWHRF
jgi:hypothetical protein